MLLSVRSLFIASAAVPQLPLSLAAGVYTTYAEDAFTTLQTWYDASTGIYDSTGWWNSANALTTIGSLAMLDSSLQAQVESVFNNSYVAAQSYNLQLTKTVQANFLPVSHYTMFSLAETNPEGFLNGYYDDEGWWAHAWIQAYDLTGNETYLQTAIDIFNDMTNGSTTPCNGGIWWDKAHTYVNAIANELYLSAASHLANRASNSSYYLTIAENQWTWFQNSGMINSNNTIADGLNSACKNNNGTVWSYNQGVILGGLVELNKASPSSSYIATANSIASAAIASLTDSNNILHDPCEPYCGGDGSQFKGVFLRNLIELQRVSPSAAYLSFIQANADAIWSADRDALNELSVVWSGPYYGPANASTQSSAMDALVAAVAFEGNGISS